MKMAINNKRWRAFRTLAAATAAAVCIAAFGTACQKTFELELPLAVTSNRLNLTKDAGSTHILVYSTGKWSAQLTENVKWASINKLSGEGNADIVFSYAANYGIARKVGVVFSSGGLRDTVMLVQAGTVTEAAINFTNRSASLISAASTITVPLTTNSKYDIEDVKVRVSYDGDEEEGDEEENDEGTWEGSASADDIDGWISDISFDTSSLTFSASGYTGSLPRIGYITLSLTDAEDNTVSTTLTVTQSNGEPQLSMTVAENTYDGYAFSYTEPVETNLFSYADQFDFEVQYSVPVDNEENEWVRNVRMTNDGLAFSLAANEDELRTATIKMTFTDSENRSVSASYKVTQKSYPKLLSFEEIRGKIAGASGEFIFITENALEGFVISDPESANVCISPQTAQFAFDHQENYKTAYVESTDGTYGFCVKFATTADNTLKRYSKIRISLKDLTLVKEDAPVRYTLKGLTADNIIEASEPNSALLPIKAKSISQLTDADLFTWVSLQNIEIAFKDGSYTNATDGYSIKNDLFNPQGNASSPRWDIAPLLLTDADGATMSMLTNAMVPWRRNNSGLLPNGVPQGAGTFNGVVVAEELVRYGDLGRYQIRAMTQSDIAMGQTPFSTTIVEWNWNDKLVDLIPEIGTGTFETYGAALAGAPDFNNVTSTDTSKGLLTNQSVYVEKKWWNFTGDSGEYFDIKFSTSGISGTNLMFGFTWNHGQMNSTTVDTPAHWKLLYSTDGTTFIEVPGVGIIPNRSITWWGTSPDPPTSQDSCPGYCDFLFKLPNDCFGKQDVTVRVQVADKTTDICPAISSTDWANNLGIGKGTITDKATRIRLGALTVRYN